MIPFNWLPEHVATIRADAMPTAPRFLRRDVPEVLPGYDLWDHWPVLTADGRIAAIAGGTLIFALVAPRSADPEHRHAVARLWLFHRTGGEWRELGPVFRDGDAPGSRQWSGSAVLTDRGDGVRLLFTAVGTHGEPVPSFNQRLFETTAALRVADGLPSLGSWSVPAECVVPDGVAYTTDMTGGGAIGSIKAFRDPYVFRDVDGCDWLLFTASAAGAPSAWNGVVGAARWTGDEWALHPPILSALGLNNELERPHAIAANGSVYLFWSTQAKVFSPDGPQGPTGLYGVVADRWGGEWRPVNGSGLVLANPPGAPAQAYSFQVLPDLSVWSFADMPGVTVLPVDATARRAAFAGGPAPVLHLALDGDRAILAMP